MVTAGLGDRQSRLNFFQGSILINLDYWHRHPAVLTLKIEALDQEREGLLRAIFFALKWAETWPLLYPLIETVSPYFERRGLWEVWNQVLEKAIAMARQVEDMAGAVTLSLLLARLLQRQSQLKAAAWQYRRTRHLARQSGDRYNEGRACTNLGYLYIEQGYWWRAHVLCCRALAIFEEIGSSHGLAHTENHLGFLALRQHQWPAARQHLERACAIWQEMGDEHGLMRGLINLGALYLDQDMGTEALPFLEKARRQARLTGEETEVGTIYMNMSKAYQQQGDLAQAEAYAWQAEAIFRRFNNGVGLAQVQDNLGYIYLRQGRWPEAEQHLTMALDRWHALGSRLGQIRVRGYLIEYELARREFRKALKRLQALEREMGDDEDDTHTQFIRLQVEKYRRSLAEVQRN